MNSINSYALITGASKGLGLAIARDLAEKGYNLILVARSADLLALAAKQLCVEFDRDVEIFSADLSDAASVDALADWCDEKRFDIRILVNNAGYGLWGQFGDSSLDDQLNMLQLNIQSLVKLTYHLLPVLKRNKPSYILNVASTAAYQALPTLSLYAASKAFVLSFSRGLRYELKDENISVTCLSPGPIDTDFANRAGLQALNEKAAKFNMRAQQVATIGVDAMFRRRSEVIPGFANKISAFASRILPKAILENIAARLYKV